MSNNKMNLSKLSKKQLFEVCNEYNIKYSTSDKKDNILKMINDYNENKKLNESKKVDDKPSQDNILLINNDCMIEIDKLEDNSIDCVITDPPYFIDKLDNSWSADDVNNDKKNSHIKHLPKGMKFDKSQIKNYMIII